jgi:hypothetical protein
MMYLKHAKTMTQGRLAGWNKSQSIALEAVQNDMLDLACRGFNKMTSLTWRASPSHSTHGNRRVVLEESAVRLGLAL